MQTAPPLALADLDTLDVRGTADRLVELTATLRQVEAHVLVLAAHFADLHAPVAPDEVDPSLPAARRRALTHGRPGGADGTPLVRAHTAEHLGMLVGTTTQGARALLRDALDLRHRMPEHWRAAVGGAVPSFRARHVARRVSVLTAEQARAVDAATIAAVRGLPYGRAMAVVDAAVVDADPEAHARRLEVAATRRYVSTGRGSSEFGLRTLIAQSTSGDIARLDAMISHLADLQVGATTDDGEPADLHTRRAQGLALLAHPALACAYLASVAPAGAADPSDDESPSPVELARLVGRAILAGGPRVLARLRPRIDLHVHLAPDLRDGHVEEGDVLRAEGIGPVTLGQLRDWVTANLASTLYPEHGSGDQIVVRPVVDLTRQASVDAYEVPRRMREQLVLRHPHEVWPLGTLASRRADLDHTVAFDRAGPPGQTSTTNLGPLGRGHHLAKTFGDFECHQPLPGLFLWATPSGHWWRVDHTGSHYLGRERPWILRCAERRTLRPTPRMDLQLSRLVLIA